MRKLLFLFLIVLFTMTLAAESYNVLGVYLYQVSQKKIDVLGLTNNYGVVIDDVVKDGPADEAGIIKDDIILTIAGEKVRTVDQIRKMLMQHKAGSKIKVEYYRNGQTKNVHLVLMEKEKKVKPYMGVYLNGLSKKEMLAEGLKNNYGIMINKVVDETPAAEAGLLDGDVLLSFNSEKIYTDSQLHEIIMDFQPRDTVKLVVFRNGKSKKINLILGQRSKEDKF